MEELVLAVPRLALPGGLPWRGVRRRGVRPYLDAIATAAEFRPRSLLEFDPAWKQIIPYLVLRDGERLFLMRRSRSGADARLHERWSIGIGGHVDPRDGDLLGGLRREWAEEIEAAFMPRFRRVGLLNDDQDPVGAVHLGVVYFADAAGRAVAIRERNKLSGEFASLDEVRAMRDGLETWSSLILDALEAPPAWTGTRSVAAGVG
jgi:predicted NUDIX family phosphoesterase